MKKKSVRSNNRPIPSIIAIFVGMIVLQGCAAFWRPPAEDPAARAWIEQANRRNNDLTQFKGLMEIRVQSGEKVTSGRAAWAAAHPDRLRIEWLSMLGQPVFTLAADGKTITLLSNTDREYHVLEQSPSTLQLLIHIPVTVDDLLLLLAGRPLQPEYVAAQRIDTIDGGDTIALKDRWHRTLAVIVVDQEGRPKSERLFDSQGEPRYRIEWLEWQQAEQRTIPRKMTLTAPSGERLQIAIVRFWDRADFDPSTFVLEQPRRDAE